MSDQQFKFIPMQTGIRPARRLPLGRQLVQAGAVTQQQMLNALGLQRRIDAQLGDILVADGLITQDQLQTALAHQHDAPLAHLSAQPPAPEMADALPAELCLRHGVVPLRWAEGTLQVATARPDLFERFRDDVGADHPPMMPMIAPEADIRAVLNRLYTRALQHKAITRVAAQDSCRDMGRDTGRRVRWAAGLTIALIGALVIAPAPTITMVLLWCVLTLVLTTGLKVCALAVCALTSARRGPEAARVPPLRLPRVSIMVPLFKEKEIASALLRRLGRLTYPKSLLEVVLVLEARDWTTRRTIERTELPSWINVIVVPDDGSITTKPRALNYALDFCKGSIIGVWDAEDAPEPDQIEKVVMQFAGAAPDVACLQGTLDFYNPRHNWLARCFTIEYAAWWRLIIPGMARLGMVLPLGGTTLFFRRHILEQLGGWDAHNVTEDADLGVRLARRGYRTELVDTVTYEEANCRPWRWVRQRSRWLKGFLVTWIVHMRRPRELVRQLGWGRALGLQIIFLATVTQFAAGPLLWSFWLIAFGFDHPVQTTLGAGFVSALFVLFICAEAVNLVLHISAVRAPARRHLLGWTLTMPAYFLLGALAAYKALFELVAQPFYWDKTEHGFAGGAMPLPDAGPHPAEGES